MMKEMYCVKVSFRGYTDECERIMTNIFIRMGLTVNKTSDKEYTVSSNDGNIINDIIYLCEGDNMGSIVKKGRKWKWCRKLGLETVPSFLSIFGRKKCLTSAERQRISWRPENVKKNRSTNFLQILSDLAKIVNFPEIGKEVLNTT